MCKRRVNLRWLDLEDKVVTQEPYIVCYGGCGLRLYGPNESAVADRAFEAGWMVIAGAPFCKGCADEREGEA